MTSMLWSVVEREIMEQKVMEQKVMEREVMEREECLVLLTQKS